MKGSRKKEIAEILVLIVVLLAIIFTGVATYLSFRPVDTVKRKNLTEVSFSWWGNDARHTYTLDGIDLFEKKNPDISVNYKFGVWNGFEKRMQMMMLSHTEADVMQVNYAWLSKYSPDGTGFYDLNKLSDIIDLSNYTEKDLSYGTIDGRLNALPIAYNMPVFYYNKDIYDKYGLDIPQTWNDLFSDAKVMRDDGVYPMSCVIKQLWLMLLAHHEQETGQKAFSDDGKFQIDEDGMKEILTFYKSLLDEKVIMPVDNFNQQFETGEVAGVQVWISDSDRYAEGLSEKGVKVVLGNNLTDTGSGFEGWYMKPATMYAISSTTNHPKEAATLLNFLVNDKDMAVLQGSEKGMPVSKTALEAVKNSGEANEYEEEGNDMLRKNMSSLSVIVPATEDDTIISTFKDEADKYIYGQEDIDTCAADICSQISDYQSQN